MAPGQPVPRKGIVARAGAKRRARAARFKSTKRGAYRALNKGAMANRRRPFVETKRKSDEDLRMANFFAGGGDTDFLVDHTDYKVYDTEHAFMDPMSFYLWSQGLNQAQHIGQAVNIKYTNMKIQVRFPQPAVFVDIPASGNIKQTIPAVPQKYELVWGWCPAPLSLTGNTTPAANTVSMTNIANHVNHRVADYFNDRKDRLRFIPKKDSTLRIIGRKMVRPDLRYQSTAQATQPDAAKDPIGSIPDYFTEISWNHKNRKLWLEQTGNINGDADLVAMYPNYSWLPFCVLVNWNYDELPTHVTHGKKLQCPSLAWNSITYFSDS